MREHYNLYYIFLEDKLKHPMPEEKRIEIWENIKKMLAEDEPDLNVHPP